MDDDKREYRIKVEINSSKGETHEYILSFDSLEEALAYYNQEVESEDWKRLTIMWDDEDDGIKISKL